MWRITGGCTVVVALFFKSRLFIANAVRKDRLCRFRSRLFDRS